MKRSWSRVDRCTIDGKNKQIILFCINKLVFTRKILFANVVIVIDAMRNAGLQARGIKDSGVQYFAID